MTADLSTTKNEENAGFFFVTFVFFAAILKI
jgi:hypothetical protein